MDITENCRNLQQSLESAVSDFQNQADVNALLQRVRTIVFAFIEELIASVVQEKLKDPGFLTTLKELGAKSALRFNGFKPTSIRLLSGRSISIDSPYFTKTETKSRRGRKSKKRKAKNGCHLGLCYSGFIDRCSIMLASLTAQTALLCPSFEVAKETLLSFGVEMNTKTIQRLCSSMGGQAMEYRHQITLSQEDRAQNRSLLVCIDGGRLRERIPKRGRCPASQKRQGYYTDWKEPTQIVIEWLDAEGEKCQETVPLYDATMGDIDAVFDLLEGHLLQIDAAKADMVIFCADGDRKYWKRFSTLAEKLNLNAHLEVIDYTHAKQNLQLVANHLPKNLGAKKLAQIMKDWKNLLWGGNLVEIYRQIRQFIKSTKKRKEALNKFKNYFLKNFKRMQYAAFRHLNLPTGSGCVESAIRRVINLRLKSPGIFWKRQTAEVMLFLRSTLLCGRWQIMLKNLLLIGRKQFIGCH